MLPVGCAFTANDQSPMRGDEPIFDAGQLTVRYRAIKMIENCSHLLRRTRPLDGSASCTSDQGKNDNAYQVSFHIKTQISSCCCNWSAALPRSIQPMPAVPVLAENVSRVNSTSRHMIASGPLHTQWARHAACRHSNPLAESFRNALPTETRWLTERIATLGHGPRRSDSINENAGLDLPAKKA